MITLDTVIQQLHIWDGQILLFIQEHLRMEALNPIVIAITNLGNTGIVWIVLSIVLLFPKKTRRAGLDVYKRQIFNVIIGFIVSVYVLMTKEKFIGQLKKIIYAIFRPRYGNVVMEVCLLYTSRCV